MLRSLAVLLCCLPVGALAASESWVVTTDLWGNHAYQNLTLERTGSGSAESSMGMR